jgi:hypothetical protein
LSSIVGLSSLVGIAGQTWSIIFSAIEPGLRLCITEALADLVARRGDLDRLRTLADDDFVGVHVRYLLAEVLIRRGDLDALRARTDDGDGSAASRLADVLPAGTWKGCRPGSTPATGTPPLGWTWFWNGGARVKKRNGRAGSA